MQQNNTFGDRLTELRENKGLSRQKAADDLGISRASLEYYEKGKRKPDIDTLLKIAGYFNVTCDYLLKGVKTENVSINETIGLSDKAIEKMQNLMLQARGKIFADEYQKAIDKIQAGLDDTRKYARESYPDVVNVERPLPYETYEKALLQNDIDSIESEKKSSIYEADIVLSTLNSMIEKEEFVDFMKSIYLYLFSEMDISKGELYGVLSPTLYSDSSLFISLDKNLINESFLLKITDYLRKWQNKGKVKIYDVEVYKGGDPNGND